MGPAALLFVRLRAELALLPSFVPVLPVPRLRRAFAKRGLSRMAPGRSCSASPRCARDAREDSAQWRACCVQSRGWRPGRIPGGLADTILGEVKSDRSFRGPARCLVRFLTLREPLKWRRQVVPHETEHLRD